VDGRKDSASPAEISAEGGRSGFECPTFSCRDEAGIGGKPVAFKGRVHESCPPSGSGRRAVRCGACCAERSQV
jgi:hypothetical protein